MINVSQLRFSSLPILYSYKKDKFKNEYLYFLCCDVSGTFVLFVKEPDKFVSFL